MLLALAIALTLQPFDDGFESAVECFAVGAAFTASKSPYADTIDLLGSPYYDVREAAQAELVRRIDVDPGKAACLLYGLNCRDAEIRSRSSRLVRQYVGCKRCWGWPRRREVTDFGNVINWVCTECEGVGLDWRHTPWLWK